MNKELKAIKSGMYVKFKYLNYKGELLIRNVIVREISYGSNEFYPTPQFMIIGYDLDKKDIRTFIFSNIKDFVVVKE